jgi:hypothetical protein
MTYPYDTDDMEPSLSVLLGLIRAKPEAPAPNGEMAELAGALSSPPLAAFTHALGSRLWNDDFARFEATAEALEDNGFYDEIVEELESVGHSDAEGILIGGDGGGSEALLMIADDARPGGYVIYFYAYDGSPYSNGKIIEEAGRFVDLFRKLAENGEISDDLKAVVAAAGE